MADPDYFIITSDDGSRPYPWRWEIGRASSPMEVLLYGSGYRSKLAAEFAGGRALKEFLAALSVEVTRARLAERAAHATMTARKQAV